MLHLMIKPTVYDTRIQGSPEIYLKKEKISGLRWESNPQPSQLRYDALSVELPSPWEQDSGDY